MDGGGDGGRLKKLASKVGATAGRLLFWHRERVGGGSWGGGGVLALPYGSSTHYGIFRREVERGRMGVTRTSGREGGVLVDVGEGRNLRQEITYGNHQRANEQKKEALTKAVEEVVRGRLMVFQAEDAGRIEGLRISSLGVGEKKNELRLIYTKIVEGQTRRTRDGDGVRSTPIMTGRRFVGVS